MKIRGIGTDITRISRIHRLLIKDMPRFTRKTLHPLERQQFLNMLTTQGQIPLRDSNEIQIPIFPDQKQFESLSKDVQAIASQYVATRWAIKESVYKALEIPFQFNKLWIQKHNRKPVVQFDADFFGDSSPVNVMVSVSHDGDLVIANVIAFEP